MITGIVQYNNDNNDYQPMNIQQACAIMTDDNNGSPLQRWAMVRSRVLLVCRALCSCFNGEYCNSCKLKSMNSTEERVHKDHTRL